MIFALVTVTRLVTPRELYEMKFALEQHAAHVAKAYMLEPPAIEVMDVEAKIPDDMHRVVFVDEGGPEGTLAEHWFDRGAQVTASRVYTHRATALNTGAYSVSESASHEIAESLCNPMLAVWLPHPHPGRAREGIEVPQEVCDPTQDTYVIDAGGTPWHVSNFVTPFWFMSAYVAHPELVRQLERSFGYGIDWCKRMNEPGEISPEGYTVLRKPKPGGGWERWSEDGFGRLGASSSKLATKQDAHSRTNKLGGVHG